MKNELDTKKIKTLLDSSTSTLSTQILDQLRGARTRALNRQRVAHSAPVLAWLGYHGNHSDSSHHTKPFNWIASMLLAACLLGGALYWQHYMTEHEISEIDIGILTDDMPLHVYVD